MRTKLPVIALLAVALLASGATRMLAAAQRASLARTADAGVPTGGSDALGRLDSFTLALLLGGLRGPLVMSLWASTEGQKTSRDLSDFDTKIELIRLLQPQFDSVHLYQVWNKAYNASADLTGLAAKYAAILDAIDYARQVVDERPANINLETQLGELYNNKLGGAQERDYYARRVREETRADEAVTRVTFPEGRRDEFRAASLRAGVSPRRLSVQPAAEADRLVAAVRRGEADQLRAAFDGEGVVYEDLPPRPVRARGVGRPLRLEPLLDAEGNILPQYAGDGGSLRYLTEYGPFPAGLSPHALAYNHFMRALALQEDAGQRHVQNSPEYVRANPGRALREWAIASFEEGRLLEAEALGRPVEPPGNSGEAQADLERASADARADADLASPELLRDAVAQYQRSLAVGRDAVEYLSEHLDQYPGAASTFASAVSRLEALRPLIEADVAYARLLLDEGDTGDLRDQARRDYAQAYTLLVDYLLRYHAPSDLLPPGVTQRNILSRDYGTREQILDRLRTEAATNIAFDHTRTVNEFDGYLDRIAARLSRLRE